MISLQSLGFSDFFSAQYEALPQQRRDACVPARISADSGDLLSIVGCAAPHAVLPGRLLNTLLPGERPTTGDWVLVDASQQPAVIEHVFSRRTVLERRAAGRRGAVQVVAANLDVCFVVTSANLEFSPRRLERYLTAIYDGGARPVILLSKVDLVDDTANLVAQASQVAPGVDVLALSSTTGVGLSQVQSYLGAGITAGLVGSSGVGKSSLTNALTSATGQSTHAVRSDDRGRHTTTRRELVVLEQDAGVLIDTPGMREFGLAAERTSVDASFADIQALAADCRFRDCRHENEPGCAVLAAVEAGTLPSARLAGLRKLLRELAAAERRADPRQAANTKRRWKQIHVAMRKSTKR